MHVALQVVHRVNPNALTKEKYVLFHVLQEILEIQIIRSYKSNEISRGQFEITGILVLYQRFKLRQSSTQNRLF